NNIYKRKGITQPMPSKLIGSQYVLPHKEERFLFPIYPLICLSGAVALSSLQVDIKQCHYIVDLETDEETPLEPRYSTSKEEWTVIAYKPFLQATRYFD
ncbi:hypothetical protein XENOCAPTIV_003532, partial [Xenoophorus captivus]